MTTRIITVCNQKGGVGKTQTVGELATVCAATGKRVLAIDADSTQGSLGAWVEQVGKDATDFDIALLTDPGDLEGIREVAEGYDLVFIDTPGSRAQNDLVDAFLRVSDFVLVTTETDGMSLEPADRYIDELVAPAGKPYAVLLTKWDARRPRKEARARAFFEEVDKPVFKSVIRSYSAFADAYEDGVFVTSAPRRTATAHNAAGDYSKAAVELLSAIATL